MGATTLDLFADKLGVYNASTGTLDEALIVELLKLLPPPKLVERYNGNLDATGQDTNDVQRTYTWDVTAIDGMTYAAGVFTADRDMTIQVHPFLEVTNGTANNRNTFLAYVEVTRADTTTSVRTFPSAYIRDDAAAYDSGATAGVLTLSMASGDSFTINTRRLDSQDPTDDNPADIARSYLLIEEYINGLL